MLKGISKQFAADSGKITNVEETSNVYWDSI